MMQIVEANPVELKNPADEPFNCNFKHPLKLNFREANL